MCMYRPSTAVWQYVVVYIILYYIRPPILCGMLVVFVDASICLYKISTVSSYMTGTARTDDDINIALAYTFGILLDYSSQFAYPII